MLNRLPSANPLAHGILPMARKVKLMITVTTKAVFASPRKLSLFSNVSCVLVFRVVKSLLNLTVNRIASASDTK